MHCTTLARQYHTCSYGVLWPDSLWTLPTLSTLHRMTLMRQSKARFATRHKCHTVKFYGRKLGFLQHKSATWQDQLSKLSSTKTHTKNYFWRCRCCNPLPHRVFADRLESTDLHFRTSALEVTSASTVEEELAGEMHSVLPAIVNCCRVGNVASTTNIVHPGMQLGSHVEEPVRMMAHTRSHGPQLQFLLAICSSVQLHLAVPGTSKAWVRSSSSSPSAATRHVGDHRGHASSSSSQDI